MKRALIAMVSLIALLAPISGHGRPSDHLVELARLHLGSAPPGVDAALTAWAQEVRLRTSVEIAHRTAVVRPGDKALFNHPLLYLGSDRPPPRPTAAGLTNLRRHLLTGGLIIVDDTGRAGPSDAYDRQVRRLFRQVTDRPFERIAATHVVYRSFYRLSRPVGRRADTGHLEGIRVGKHYAVIYIRDDLSGAFLRSPTGGPALRAVPGGEPQRERAHRLAINLVMYALCLDYKDDHTHVTHLLRNRRGSRPKGSKGADGR